MLNIKDSIAAIRDSIANKILFKPTITNNGFVLTMEKFQEILGNNTNIRIWYDISKKFFPIYEINNPRRVAAFMAQICHESNYLKVLVENLNYSSERLLQVFPKYFKNVNVSFYHRKPEKIANRVYANRMGNGNEISGDGWKYRGKGAIQITGYNNHKAFADYKKIDIDQVRDYLLTREGAFESACWFWKINNLNTLADSQNIKAITKRINGGYNGLADRTNNYNKFIKILL